MSDDVKKLKTPIIIASTVAILAIIYFGYQQYLISKQLDKFVQLIAADNAFFKKDFDEAFALYENLEDDFFPDSLMELRKSIHETLTHASADTSAGFLNNEAKNEMIAFLLNCNTRETAEGLQEKSDGELVDMLKHCYKSAKSEKQSYRDKAMNVSNMSYVHINGDKIIHYFGEVQDGKANGLGIGIWENQSIYDGEWKDNMRHGIGVFTTEKGEIYQGEYKNNKRNGRGTYFFRNGDFYSGEWEDSKRSGFGTVISAKGDTLVHGFWENDRFDRKKTRQEL
jgi:hypothetical protein